MALGLLISSLVPTARVPQSSPPRPALAHPRTHLMSLGTTLALNPFFWGGIDSDPCLQVHIFHTHTDAHLTHTPTSCLSRSRAADTSHGRRGCGSPQGGGELEPRFRPEGTYAQGTLRWHVVCVMFLLWHTRHHPARVEGRLLCSGQQEVVRPFPCSPALLATQTVTSCAHAPARSPRREDAHAPTLTPPASLRARTAAEVPAGLLE